MVGKQNNKLNDLKIKSKNVRTSTIFLKTKKIETKGVVVCVSPPLLHAYLYRIPIIHILFWNDVLITRTVLAMQLDPKYTLTSARFVSFSRSNF